MSHDANLTSPYVADHDLYLLKLASLLDAMDRYAAGLPVTAFPPRFSLN